MPGPVPHYNAPPVPVSYDFDIDTLVADYWDWVLHTYGPSAYIHMRYLEGGEYEAAADRAVRANA